MKISAVNSKINNVKPTVQKKSCNILQNCAVKPAINYSSSNIRANFLPVSFGGNAPAIKNAFIITNKDDIPLLETKNNGSYVIDFDSQTEVVYGEKAISYLNKNGEFLYDTQVIIPKKCEGTLEIKGKTVPLNENSAVMINGGTEAKVNIKKGYPMVIFSKKDYDWYERYGKKAQNEGIKNKFAELTYYNSHLYNGDFPPSMLLPEELKNDDFLSNLGINKYQSANNLIYDLESKREMMSEEKRSKFDKSKAIFDKLFDENIIETKANGYIGFKQFYNNEFQENLLMQKGFTKEEIAVVMPIFRQTRMVHADSRFARAGSAKGMPDELISRLKESGILHNNKKNTDMIYWKESFGNEETLKTKLQECGFNEEEKETVLKYWQESNNTGFDISGLKFIDKNVAVYNLNDKLNNWTLEKTNWVTNSTALTSNEGQTPFIGASLVQTNDKNVYAMSDLRKDEKLHKHPNLSEKRQTEMYLITSGAAALIIVKDGKPEVKILKEGDLAVIDPGVEHCVNSVLGEYEHIVAQVPSAFQYGFEFKCIAKEPEGFNKEAFTQEAKYALKESREPNLI